MKTITISKLFTTTICLVALVGCQGSSSTGGAKTEKKTGQVLAEVNGGSITTGDFERELKNLPEYLKAMADTPQGRKEMLDTMVIRELILQQAAKDGLDKGPEIEDKLQDLKKRLVVESFLKKKVEVHYCLFRKNALSVCRVVKWFARWSIYHSRIRPQGQAFRHV